MSAVTDFADNPEPRCPCLLLLDNSGSMAGPPIDALNQGLRAFTEAINADPLARRRVEVAMLTFGHDVMVRQEFVTVDAFEPPLLTAAGATPMGTAIIRGLDLLEARRELYKSQGVGCYRPWVFLITDGTPTGEAPMVFEEAVRRIRRVEESGQAAFFAVAVDGADLAKLTQLTPRGPRPLNGLRFAELFLWLSRSMQRVSQSRLGESVELPPLDGWAKV